jgi:hypothetical protein
MFLRVLLILSISLLFTACNKPAPKPKKPDVQTLGIEVVEEIDMQNDDRIVKETTQSSTATTDSKSSKSNSSSGSKSSKKKKSKAKKDQYGFRPEPFSIEADEHDPELLGPQTTLDQPLASN